MVRLTLTIASILIVVRVAAAYNEWRPEDNEDGSYREGRSAVANGCNSTTIYSLSLSNGENRTLQIHTCSDGKRPSLISNSL